MIKYNTDYHLDLEARYCKYILRLKIISLGASCFVHRINVLNILSYYIAFHYLISRIVILHHIYLILHYRARTPLYHTMRQCISHQLVSCKEMVATLLNSGPTNFYKNRKNLFMTLILHQMRRIIHISPMS